MVFMMVTHSKDVMLSTNLSWKPLIILDNKTHVWSDHLHQNWDVFHAIITGKMLSAQQLTAHWNIIVCHQRGRIWEEYRKESSHEYAELGHCYLYSFSPLNFCEKIQHFHQDMRKGVLTQFYMEWGSVGQYTLVEQINALHKEYHGWQYKNTIV